MANVVHEVYGPDGLVSSETLTVPDVTDPLAAARAVLVAQADPNATDPPANTVLTALAQVALGTS